MSTEIVDDMKPMCKNYEFSASLLEEAGWNGVIDHSGPHERDVLAVRNRNGDWELVLGYSLNNLDDVGAAADLDKTEDTEEEHGSDSTGSGEIGQEMETEETDGPKSQGAAEDGEGWRVVGKGRKMRFLRGG